MLFTLFLKGNSSECWNFCSLVTKPFSCIVREYQLVNGKCECMVNFYCFTLFFFIFIHFISQHVSFYLIIIF